MISPRTRIKDVLAAHPETGVVFARHGLDTCCGGAHPVEMAARAHKLDLATLLIPANALFGVVIWCTLDVRVVTSPATDEITLESRVGALIERRPEVLQAASGRRGVPLRVVS